MKWELEVYKNKSYCDSELGVERAMDIEEGSDVTCPWGGVGIGGVMIGDVSLG